MIWWPSACPLVKAAEYLLYFVGNFEAVEHTDTVGIQSETWRERNRRPHRNVKAHRRRQILRCLLPPKAVEVAQASVHLHTRGEILPAEKHGWALVFNARGLLAPSA